MDIMVTGLIVLTRFQLIRLEATAICVSVL